MATVLRSSPRRFVSTPAIDRLTVRALRYLQSGFSVHLRGPAGTRKTTLSLHLADLLERPMMLMFGDDEAKTSDLIGKQSGYTRKKVVDNYIHSVLKIEDQVRQTWVDSRLTLACREGYTLIYDEFNRSRPEVNNILLSVLEEKLLILPPESNGVEYIKVSPHFRAIFTSNPEEYCGVHSTQDALMDRIITIDVPEPDELTQQEIVIQKTQLDRITASTIVNVVRAFREGTLASTNSGIGASGLRSCLMIGKICKDHEIVASYDNAEFRDLCLDILRSRSALSVEESTTLIWQILRPENAILQPPSALRDLIPVVVDSSEMSETSTFETSIFDASTQEVIAKSAKSMETSPTELTQILTTTKLIETNETLDEAFELALEDRFDAIEQRFEAAVVSMEELVSVEDGVEETIPYLDDATMQAVLEEANDHSNTVKTLDVALPDNDLFNNDEVFDEVFQPSEETLLNQVPDSQLLDSGILDLKVDFDSALELDATEMSNLENLEFSTEDELYGYLKTCDNGARLSQIESDLRLSRTRAVEAIRVLAKNNRLAQRDRHFFAID